MGLAISVGALAEVLQEDPEGAVALAASIEQANAALRLAGLPPHEEPARLPELQSRAAIASFPYSFLHHLRRAYAYARQDGQWRATPVPESEDPSDDAVLEAEADMLSSHLLCHSDCEGYYFPIVFDDIVFADETTPILGGMLGSSYRLREELVVAAPALGIFLLNEQLSDDEAERINARIDIEGPLHKELVAWLAIFEACRLSIEHKTAIMFN